MTYTGNKEKELPLIEQVYLEVTRMPGEFIARDLIDRLPHIKTNYISIYLGELENRNVVMRAGYRVLSTHAGYAKKRQRRVILWRKVPNHEKPTFGRKPAAPKQPKGIRAKVPEPRTVHGFDERIEIITELLLLLASEVEALKLENMNDIEFAREYGRRKKARESSK